MATTRPLAILGAGNAATALALLLARHARPVHLYSIEDDVTIEINRSHRNTKYLQGIQLPKNIRAFGNAAEAVHRADVVFVAVPAVFFLPRPAVPVRMLLINKAKGVRKISRDGRATNETEPLAKRVG